MFNSFKADKMEEDIKKFMLKEKRMRKWQQRYKTEVMPNLVQKFNRRINGFAKKMEDEPVVLQKDAQPNGDSAVLRKFDKKLNITSERFKFRDSGDWNNLNPVLEGQRGNFQKDSHHRDIQSTTAYLRSIFSESKYQPRKVEYRSRQKNKEINPPMRYDNQNLSVTLSLLPKIKKERKKGRQNDKVESKNPSQERQSKNGSKESIDGDSLASPLAKLSQNDLVSSGYFAKKFQVSKKHVKTEQQLRQEAELKALAQNKLYFKSLFAMQQKMQKNNERSAILHLLQKCGVKKPTQEKFVKEEVDQLLQFMVMTPNNN